MSSIDIDTLLQVYFAELKTLLPISGLSVRLEEEMIHIGKVKNGKVKRTLSCTCEHREFAKVTYFSHKSLSICQTNSLQSLHHFFKMSLFNAIKHHHVKRLATKDHLTSLGNRAAFDEALNKMISVAKRTETTFSVLAFDLNKFKAVNDTYGHLQGDQILMAFAQVLARCIRDTDQAFRFGGDEFCCLLFEATEDSLALITNRIHQEVANDPMLKKYGVSTSIGQATFEPSDSANCLFERADKALYSDKKNKEMRVAS